MLLTRKGKEQAWVSFNQNGMSPSTSYGEYRNDETSYDET